VNPQIARLFAFFLLLFGLLLAFTSRWSVFEAESLEQKTVAGKLLNRRALFEALQIPRGRILASDGRVLARSSQRGSGEESFFERSWPMGQLFAHEVGYAFLGSGQISGIEQSWDDTLSGRKNEFASLIDELEGRAREGDDINTALDPAAQRRAVEGLRSGLGCAATCKGSVVALEPSTGRVLVMASLPTYDPNRFLRDSPQLRKDSNSPLLVRSTQAGYPPGSAMKVVTAAAALDSGEFSPDSVLDGRSPRTIGGAPLGNANNQQFGQIDLTDALTNSVNTVWAQVGERLGKEKLYSYMDRFGFNRKPPLDFPRDQRFASGVYDDESGKLLREAEGVDIGRVAVGQERLLVTPLQMAMVAATVANGGKLMSPHFVDRATAPDGTVEERVRPEEEEQVMKPETARVLGGMMSRVVEEGTGTQAALSGVQVAGKTGTATFEGTELNQPWFIGFAPANDPKVAIAVTLERSTEQGGTAAAPIAKEVIQELLNDG
jgi:penicillin-binding protein A